MNTMLRGALVSAALLSVQTAALASSTETPCHFDVVKTVWVGTPTEQAACLMRHVKRYGKLDAQVPFTAFGAKVGLPFDVPLADLQSYLSAYGVSEADIGGPLTTKLNAKTKYFFIHDTSTPNFKAAAFPPTINEANGPGNKLANYSPRAHVYINRAGQSATKVPFDQNMRTTKFELLSSDRKFMAVGIELTQPRRSYPSGTTKNDADAPEPGFTKEQYQRLAVTYFAASYRAGTYLIPAFHSVVDAGLHEGHDDPQNFDLAAFEERFQQVLFDLRAPL